MLFNHVDEKGLLPVTEMYDDIDEYVSFPVTDELQETYFELHPDETVLVLLSNNGKSLLTTGEIDAAETLDIPEEGVSNVVQVEAEACGVISENGETVNAWIIPDKQKRELNSTTNGEIERDSNGDPTDGTWLLLKTEEISRNDKSGVISTRRVYINKAFRENIALPCGNSVKLLCEVIDEETGSVKRASSGEVSIPDSGKRITVPENVAADAGIGMKDKLTAIWLNTESIADNETVCEPEVETKVEDEPRNDDEVGEIAFSTATNDTSFDAVEVQENTDTVEVQENTGAKNETADDKDETTATVNNISASGGDARRFGEHTTENTTDQQQKEKTSKEQTDSTPQPVNDDHEQNTEIENNGHVEIDYTPSLVPVVLLDDDERTAEQWTGHYMNGDEELLCGKTYTAKLKDPEKEHYDRICLDCVAAKPGAIKERDIALAIEEFVDFTVGEEAPFVFSHEDAANLLQVLLRNN